MLLRSPISQKKKIIKKMCTSIVPRVKPQRTRHQNNMGRQHRHLTFNTAHDPAFLKYARISYYPTSWFKGGGGDTVLPWNCPSFRRGGQLGRCDENGFTWYYSIPQQLHITQPPSLWTTAGCFSTFLRKCSARRTWSLWWGVGTEHKASFGS